MAERYFSQGEYDKAAVHYKKLFYDKGGVAMFYQPYFETLMQLGDLGELNRMADRAFKQSNGDVSYLADLGYAHAVHGDRKTAEGHYARALDLVAPQQFAYSSLAAKFMGYREMEYAEKTYLQGRRVLGDESLFSFELAYLYAALSDYESMIGAYLQELQVRPDRLRSVQNGLQRYLSDDNYPVLEAALLKRTQREPRAMVYQELLAWMYMHMNDFDMAFVQVRSIDINFGSDGRGVLDLARAAAAQQDWDVSIRAYQYLTDKGPANNLFVTASLELINTKRDKLLHSPYYSETDLRSLEAAYRQFIDRHYRDYTTAYAVIELARLEAFYLHDTDTAIHLLNDVLTWPQLNRDLEARAKLDLGDYYLLTGEHWESVLLYGQVEKAFRGSPIAEEAKLKSARLSYFKGDFEWSKTQLDILKSSTTELISNDAIELSVFIADNLNLDTTDHPMILFARADLLVYQNRFDEAVYELEGLTKLYPRHSLTDDVYFKRAEIAIKQQRYEEAAGWLDRILEEYPQEILADNALFMLGDLYMNYLKDEDRAREAYEALILNHQGSTFVVEARKKYRQLRGDAVN